MPISRIAYTVVACTAAVVLLAFTARAADAPAPVPVVTLTGSETPGHLPIAPGTPLTVHLHVRFSSNPPGGDFVLQGVDFNFHSDAHLNGALFPSCSASRLRYHNGDLHVCPKGSQIGGGSAAGRAVELGISASGKLTMFNGPGGKSITLNFSLVQPAQINATWSDPIVSQPDKHTILIKERDPVELQSVLGGDIDVTRIDLNVGATRIVHGKRRAYIEAGHCHGGSLHTKYYFKGGVTTTSTTRAPC
jgi:hypothetical protein